MREILFKGKKEVSIEWIEGFLSWIDTRRQRNHFINNHVVISETVCQFTGLTDENGVKIFEGDFDEDGNMVVWCDRCHGWQFAQIDVPTKDIFISCHRCDGNFDFSEHVDDFVIVGNIHDN